jgi:hypothetical protein
MDGRSPGEPAHLTYRPRLDFAKAERRRKSPIAPKLLIRWRFSDGFPCVKLTFPGLRLD